MPIFVWYAIAIAMLLLSGGYALKTVIAPFAQVATGPIGYVIAFGMIAIIGIITWNKTRKNKSEDDE